MDRTRAVLFNVDGRQLILKKHVKHNLFLGWLPLPGQRPRISYSYVVSVSASEESVLRRDRIKKQMQYYGSENKYIPSQIVRYARIADVVCDDAKVDKKYLKHGIKPLSKVEIASLGLNPTIFDKQGTGNFEFDLPRNSGFYSELFYDETAQAYVLAFRGTEGANDILDFLKANIPQSIQTFTSFVGLVRWPRLHGRAFP